VVSNHNRASVVTVAEKVCKSKFEIGFLGSKQVGTLDILDVITQLIRTLRLWVITSWTLSQTAIVATPATIALATLELVRCPQISPCIYVDVVCWQVSVACSVIV
jgi:hypothetical protein